MRRRRRKRERGGWRRDSTVTDEVWSSLSSPPSNYLLKLALALFLCWLDSLLACSLACSLVRLPDLLSILTLALTLQLQLQLQLCDFLFCVHSSVESTCSNVVSLYLKLTDLETLPTLSRELTLMIR